MDVHAQRARTVTPALAAAVDAAVRGDHGPPPFTGIARGVAAVEALADANGWRRPDAAVDAAIAACPGWRSTRSAQVKALPPALRGRLQAFAVWLYIFLPPTFTADAARADPGPSMAVLHAMDGDLEARNAHRLALVRASIHRRRTVIGRSMIISPLGRRVFVGMAHRQKRRSGARVRRRRARRPRRRGAPGQTSGSGVGPGSGVRCWPPWPRLMLLPRLITTRLQTWCVCLLHGIYGGPCTDWHAWWAYICDGQDVDAMAPRAAAAAMCLDEVRQGRTRR